MIKILLFISFFLSNILQANTSLESLWLSMQQEYCKIYDTENISADYCHAFWQDNQQKVKDIILGPLNTCFVRSPCIGGSMVRNEWTVAQAYEACYLKYCLNEKVHKLIKSYKDTDLIPLKHSCLDFNCSINTLGHLFYAAKALEQFNDPQEIKTIIEFGSGYGNLARIFKAILPEATLILIDLPELLALQYFFLKATLSEQDINVHATAPNSNLLKRGIHLIPIHLLKDFELSADLFISTFALTETSPACQELVTQKKFFNARISYISGQLDGWGKDFNFVNHTLIHKAIRDCYSKVRCLPFHLMTNNPLSYEMIGIN